MFPRRKSHFCQMKIEHVLLLVALVTARLASWKHCYGEDLDAGMNVVNGMARLDGDRVMMELNVNLTRPFQGGRYVVEIWYSGNGDKIVYNGPFDVCSCGFVNFGNPECDSSRVCPIPEGMVKFKVGKPLHKDFGGMYEATLKIFDLTDTEAMCLDLPFVYKKEETKDGKEVMILKEVGLNV